jgi:hypothetical protein
VLLHDVEKAMTSGMADLPTATDGDQDEEGGAEPAKPAQAAAPAKETEETIAKRRVIADALAREVGYRAVEYLGNDRFRVDYSMSGRLDRGFAYPINLDALAIAPWIVVEVRQDGTARMKAPAFGDPDESMGGPTGKDKDAGGREGTFTFTTDAQLVMQNNEDGLAAGTGTRIVWKITPATKAVPTAVVKF